MAIAEGRMPAYDDGSPVDYRLQMFLARLAERIARATAAKEVQMAENIAAAGFVVGKNGVPEWRAHLELLKHSEQWRNRWYERRELHVDQRSTLDVTVRRQVDQLPMADVLELAGPDFAELVPADTAQPQRHEQEA